MPLNPLLCPILHGHQANHLMSNALRSHAVLQDPQVLASTQNLQHLRLLRQTPNLRYDRSEYALAVEKICEVHLPGFFQNLKEM